MKLSKTQLEYIKTEQERMSQRLKDLNSFGDDIYKSASLSAERGRIYYNQWFFNHIIKLHKVEVDAEKRSMKALEDEVERVMKDDDT